MRNLRIICFFIVVTGQVLSAQTPDFSKFDFLLGDWQGSGKGFGNDSSKIEASYKSVMEGRYLQFEHDSRFAPTAEKPQGEHHQDWGMVSFDKYRKLWIYRQFNNEGYVNQYFLNDSLSNDATLVFSSEKFENFPAGGRAQWTIKKTGEMEIVTIFEVSFPGKNFMCLGTNRLNKIKKEY